MAWSVVIQSFSVLVAAISVVIGVTSWRRSEIGKRRVDLAEETLETFGKIRDAFHDIRSPVSFAYEGSSRVQRAGETEEETEILNRAHIVFERYKKHIDVFNKAYALKFRAEAYFGNEARACFDEMLQVRNEVFASAHKLSRYWKNQGRTSTMNAEQFERHLERMHAAEDVFWAGGADDLINTRINASVAQIEAICRQTIRPHPTLCGHFKSISNFCARYLGLKSYD